MPNPQSFNSNLVTSLIEYLEQETIAFEPGLTWSSYQVDIAPGNPPLGAVYIPSWTVLNQGGYDSHECQFEIVILMLFCKTTVQEAIVAANAWGGYLCEQVIPKLRKEGYNELFKGIDIKPGVTIQEPVVNQDRGARTSLVIRCQWKNQLISNSDFI